MLLLLYQLPARLFKIGYKNNSQVDIKEIEFNPDFVNRMLSRLEWSVLVETASQLGVNDGLPEMLPENQEIEDEETLKKV